MALFEMTDSDFRRIDPTSFGNENIKERQDLQRLLKDHIDEIAPDCMVIDEEFGNWQDSQRRIDLLCVDKQGNLVVVELKREQTGQHMDLQALRYAAMISAMTFAQAMETYEGYIKRNPGNPSLAKENLANFIMDEDDENGSLKPEERFNRDRDVKIILVSSGFSKELTTAALWLRDYNLDIRCVKMTPYRHNEQLLVHAELVIPIPEAEEYTIKIATKNAEQRSVRPRGERLPSDQKFEITVGGQTISGLGYETVVPEAIKLLMKQGVSLERIQGALSERRLTSAEGRLSRDEMEERIDAAKIKGPRGRVYSSSDFQCEDGALFFDGGRTWALKRTKKAQYASNRLDMLKGKFPEIFDFRAETAPDQAIAPSPA